MERCTEEMKLWLFDLAHGNLDQAGAARGFLKYYALYDMTVGSVVQDIVFHTVYGTEGAETARRCLEEAFRSIA